ncbi:EmrB/QacA subfamily drug resistance transporter [Bradyrhizobium sp. i1.3.1]
MSGPNASLMVPGLRRNMVTICAMTATIMQALDTTIANVALPYMQGSLSASQDQINWVLTSYIVAAAIMTAPVGWIANRFGRKRIFIICAAGFTFASVLCGLAQDINQMVLFRLLQGVFGAALVPLSQSVMLDYYTLQERAKAMSIWGMGVMMGPIMGPSLGAWLTETYSWHWVFFVNLPFGAITVLGLIVFMDETKKDISLKFDWFGFAALAIAIGSLQLALDRGEQLGWLESGEIIAEFIVSAVAFYFFLAHSFTTSTPFIRFALFKDRNFVTGCMFMVVMGLVLFSTMALASPYMQNVIGYPIITAGLLLASRGFGTFFAMMLVGRMMRYFEARTLIITGLTLTAGSLFQMTGWTDLTQVPEIVTVSVIQGFGFGLVFRAALDGGVPDPVERAAHRRHRDADPDAQRRELGRHLRRHRRTDAGNAEDLRDPVRVHQPVQPRAPDAQRQRHDQSLHRRRPRHGRQDGQRAGADHRLRTRLYAGDDLHPLHHPARLADRLDQGHAAQAGRGAGTCGDGVTTGVMPRLDRGIQYAAASPNPTTVSGILGRAVKPGNDSEQVARASTTTPRSPNRPPPSSPAPDYSTRSTAGSGCSTARPAW